MAFVKSHHGVYTQLEVKFSFQMRCEVSEDHTGGHTVLSKVPTSRTGIPGIISVLEDMKNKKTCFKEHR